ncbi:hypothetical protein SCHIN_v1c05890 [Spiroplasma chinense]|uniref:Lipoprotein n=1 Tax=Spiroplasma chinense TaxID=216932 RepID=A0A5B9Y509_9MOLU|nr:lipoprotein [Spiroplasma chinense]QEH61786.1 hypothetical protein SCHIN_v1c05890 [Spiroplasma chinense]
MKKLLTIFAAFGLTGVASASVVACDDTADKNLLNANINDTLNDDSNKADNQGIDATNPSVEMPAINGNQGIDATNPSVEMPAINGNQGIDATNPSVEMPAINGNQGIDATNPSVEAPVVDQPEVEKNNDSKFALVGIEDVITIKNHDTVEYDLVDGQDLSGINFTITNVNVAQYYDVHLSEDMSKLVITTDYGIQSKVELVVTGDVLVETNFTLSVQW